MSHQGSELTHVLPVTQTSREKETVDVGLSRSHPAIWGLRAGCPAPELHQGQEVKCLYHTIHCCREFHTRNILNVDII